MADNAGRDAGGNLVPAAVSSETVQDSNQKALTDLVASMFEKFSQKIDARMDQMYDELSSKRFHSDVESESEGDSHESRSKKGKLSGHAEQDVLIVQEENDLDETEKAFLDRKSATAVSQPSTSGTQSVSATATSGKFAQLEQEYSETEKLGAKVSDDLAGLLNGRFSKKLGKWRRKISLKLIIALRIAPNSVCLKSTKRFGSCCPRIRKNMNSLRSTFSGP